MTAINVNVWPAVRQVRQVGHFHKVFIGTGCTRNIAKWAFAALAALISIDSWREIQA